jgi:hypothetical protein
MIEGLGLPDRFELLPADVPVAALGAAWLGAHGGDMGGVDADGIPADDVRTEGGLTQATGPMPEGAGGAVPDEMLG